MALAGVGLAGFALSAVAALLATNLLVKSIVVVLRLPLGYGLRLTVLHWRFPLLVALVIGLLVLRGRLGRTLARRSFDVGVAAALLTALSLAVLAAGPYAPVRNRWSFFLRTPPGGSRLLPSRVASMPDELIEVNSLGFRDRERSLRPPPRTRRVLLVGESFVVGSGIANPKGMLHTQLEFALDASGDDDWEVVNVAQRPAALWYYTRALIALVPDMEPEVVVMSYLSWYDLEWWETQRVSYGLPPFLVGLCDSFEVTNDMLVFAKRLTESYQEQGRADPSVVADLRASLEELLRVLERRRIPLVVWLPYESDGMFEPYAHHPLLSLLGWEAVPYLSPREAGDLGAAPVPRWQEDPALHFVGDGHPTPAANRMFARAIAEEIRRVTRSR